jgi:hypothetical protein
MAKVVRFRAWILILVLALGLLWSGLQLQRAKRRVTALAQQEYALLHAELTQWRESLIQAQRQPEVVKGNQWLRETAVFHLTARPAPAAAGRGCCSPGECASAYPPPIRRASGR